MAVFRGRGLPTLAQQALAGPAPYVARSAEAERPAWPVNPFPKGIRPGSATEKILAALNTAHPRWLEHWQLMSITGCSRGAVAWGMRYLAAHGLVRSIASARHPQYLRYSAVKVAK